MTKLINIHVWTVTFNDDDPWSMPVIGATRQQAHDGMLAYLIEYLCEMYEHDDGPTPDWRAFTDVNEILKAANEEALSWKLELYVSVHQINASDIEYTTAEEDAA